MTNPIPEAPKHYLVLIFLAACFLAILLTSLWQRFTNPALTVNHFAHRQQEEPVKPGNMENMAAIGQLMEAVAKNPHDVPGLLRLTESLISVGQWSSAENFALKALSEPGENTRAMYLLAVINHNQGKHTEAAELLEKLLQKEENPSARYSLAILYIHFLNQPEEGRQQLQKGLLTPGAPAGLRTAMQEEMAKLPPVSPETIAPDPTEQERQETSNGQTEER